MSASVVLFIIVLAILAALYFSVRLSAEAVKGWKLSREKRKNEPQNAYLHLGEFPHLPLEKSKVKKEANDHSTR